MLRTTGPWVSVLALAVLVAGCSTADQLRRDEQKAFVKTLGGSDAKVLMSGERSVDGTDFFIQSDSLSWRSVGDGSRQSAALSEVNMMVTKDGALGGLEGLLMGTGAGAAAFALILAASPKSGKEDYSGAVAGLLVGGGIAVGGTVAGVIIGHTRTHVFLKE